MRTSWRKLAAAAAVLLLVLAGGALWWRPWAPEPEPAQVERFAYPLPDKPSIAVLPFINVSGDVEHDHLAEGLTDDLITELSKVSSLFVIARHSVFALQDTARKIQDVAAELGVHYVLEGTLRGAGSRIRINVSLIDAFTGLSLWAERYDREFADLFAVQDDVIGKIISALSVELTAGSRTSSRGSPPTIWRPTTTTCARSRKASTTATSIPIAGPCPSIRERSIWIPISPTRMPASRAWPWTSGATTTIFSGRRRWRARSPTTPPGKR